MIVINVEVSRCGRLARLRSDAKENVTWLMNKE
jgi:hypothetical protein